MAYATVRSKEVLLLLIYCLLLLPLSVGGGVFGLCYVIQYLISVLSGFAIIMIGKGELKLVALLQNCFPTSVL